MKFNELKNINSELLKSLSEINFETLSPIQEKTIPYALEGFDIIAQAPTGTGKTASFGIPILNNLNSESNYIEHLVIAPTRELSMQIYNQFIKLGKYLNLKIALIIGGVSYEKQFIFSNNNMIKIIIENLANIFITYNSSILSI